MGKDIDLFRKSSNPMLRGNIREAEKLLNNTAPFPLDNIFVLCEPVFDAETLHLRDVLLQYTNEIENPLEVIKKQNLNIRKDKLYRIKYSKLKDLLSYTRRNKLKLVECFNQLRREDVAYIIKNKKTGESEIYGVTSWLQNWGYNKKTHEFIYRFSTTIVELAQGWKKDKRKNKGYHYSHIKNTYKLSPRASLLYRKFNMYLLQGKSPEWRIEEIYTFLGLPEDYKYKYFNRDVLKPALKEIEKKTNIKVEGVIPTQSGREITGMYFLLSQ